MDRSVAAIGDLFGAASRTLTGTEPTRKQNRVKAAGEPRWRAWLRWTIEIVALLSAALLGVLFALGRLADWFTGNSFWSHTVPFAGGILLIGVAVAGFLRLWFLSRRWLAGLWPWCPPLLALVFLGLSSWAALQPGYGRQIVHLQSLIGGPVEAERLAIAHQVFASYRRADHADMLVILERSRVYEPTVFEAAEEFGVEPEVLIGVGATESSFYPRRSNDGGEGLFQITKPPASAVEAAKKALGIKKLDPVNQRHNAFVGAATLRRYLDEMRGDLFLGLLAYNIGPKNGGLLSIMKKYGAKDFVTIQPYLKNLPRDYPVRVLSAALAYRLWKKDGALPRYEEGDNAVAIQMIGIPGLELVPKVPDVPVLQKAASSK